MRQAGSHRSYGSKVLSQKRAASALTQLLVGCRPEQLATFTPEGLAGSYRVPVAKCAEMLARAREGRGG